METSTQTAENGPQAGVPPESTTLLDAQPRAADGASAPSTMDAAQAPQPGDAVGVAPVAPVALLAASLAAALTAPAAPALAPSVAAPPVAAPPAAAPPAAASVAAPPAAQPVPALTKDEQRALLLSQMAQRREAIVNKLGMIFTNDGLSPSYIAQLKREAQRMLEHADATVDGGIGWAPEDFVINYVAGRSPSGNTRRLLTSAADKILGALPHPSIGIHVKPQIHKTYPEVKKERSMNGNGASAAPPAAPSAAPSVAPPAPGHAAPLPQFAQPPPQFAQQPAYSVPMPMPATMPMPLPPAAPRPAPQRHQPHLDQVGLPYGGYFKFYRRSDGTDPRVPPGQMTYIGQYLQSSVQGDVAEFIRRYVTPQWGPRAGEPDAIYVVYSTDIKGNNTRDPIEIAVAAPITDDGPMNFQQPGARRNAPAVPPPPATASASDKVLELLMRQLEAQQRRADEMASKPNLDSSTMMQLMEMRRSGEDLARQISEVRKEKANERRWQRPAVFGGVDDDFNRPLVPTGLGAPSAFPPLAPLPPLQPLQPSTDPVVELARTLVEKSFAQPQHVPDPAQTMVMDLFKTLMTSMVGNKQPDLTMEMIRQANDRASKAEDRLDRLQTEYTKPEKKGGLAELLEAMKGLKEIREQVDPQQQPPGVLDVLMHAIEHAPKIGEALGAVAAAQAAAQVGAAAGTQAAAPASTPSAAPSGTTRPRQLPDAGKLAVKEMLETTTEQGVIDALFKLVAVVASHPEWQPLALMIRERFMSADSKPELRRLVGLMMENIGARKLAGNEMFIEKVAAVLHKHYSALHKQISGGQEKTLPDVTVVPVASVVTPAPAPAPTPVAAAAPVATPVAVPPAPTAAEAAILAFVARQPSALQHFKPTLRGRALLVAEYLAGAAIDVPDDVRRDGDRIKAESADA